MERSARTWTLAGKPTVLVVETSPREQAWIRDALEPAYQVEFAGSLGEALPDVGAHAPDLFLAPAGSRGDVDVELSLEVSNRGRRRAVPIVLRAASAPRDDASSDALRARIRARLDETRSATTLRPTVREWGRLRIDFETLRVWVLEGAGADEVLDLTLREFRVLQFLVENEGRVVTRRELLDQVWRDVVVAPRAVDTHVCNLRKKLGPLRACIGSIRGVGYRFQTERA